MMANFRVATALASTFLLLLVCLYLLVDWRTSLPNTPNAQTTSSRIWDTLHQLPFFSAGPERGADRPALNDKPGEFLLGVGKADITGPVVEVNLMGYADPAQLGTGLRQRLYSRAFIIGSLDKPEERFVYIVLDTQSGDTAVRYGILDGLANLGSDFAVYGQNNVAVIGTHSHSGPGAWLNYLLPQITSKGFDKQSYQAIVDGAVLSIKRAHSRLEKGSLTFGFIQVKDANINRSPFAYLANPSEERSRYQDDVDKTMTMLKFESTEDQKTMGVLTWFPVHGTSMLGNNTLISGDNKGVAATLLEQHFRGSPGVADDFVGGFSQANVGDTSPNVLGAYCEDGSGEQCNFEDSTCNGRNEPCHGRGPFFREKDEGAASCFEIGRRQFEAAKNLLTTLSDTGIPIRGSTVKSFHKFHDLSDYTFTHPNGSIVSTCPAALGYSFAAGTTDGPGAFDFKQNNTGSPNANPVWAVVSGLLKEPSEVQRACHAPKPILLDVGEIDRPYQWTPNIVDVQLFRVGQLIMIISPGEATTMAGRRWKETIHNTAKILLDIDEPLVVLGGPANSYTHYIATEEEYGIQRYEGASTLYGPHTLNAHIDLTTIYLPDLHSKPSKLTPPGPFPPNNVNASLNFITGVVQDSPGFFSSFGDVLTDVESTYTPGTTVKVTFVGANPRNNLRLEETYVAVEHFKLNSWGSDWHPIRDDADWDLIFQWRRTNSILGTSEVDVTWEMKDDVPAGRYRIRYFGASKALLGGAITEIEGLSGEFQIL